METMLVQKNHEQKDAMNSDAFCPKVLCHLDRRQWFIVPSFNSFRIYFTDIFQDSFINIEDVISFSIFVKCLDMPYFSYQWIQIGIVWKYWNKGNSLSRIKLVISSYDLNLAGPIKFLYITFPSLLIIWAS